MEFKKKNTSFARRSHQHKIHKKELATRTKTWGTVKFKPQAFRSNKPAFTPPNPEATAKPWQHVKNDIIDDSEELSHASRLNVDSEDARQFMQQREQNHRRNIIESNRAEPTKWESFDDEQQQQQQQPSTSSKSTKQVKKARFGQCDKSKGELPTDVKNFGFKERNFFRRKITMGLGLATSGNDLEAAINDLKRNNSQLQPGATTNNFKALIDPNPVKKRKGGGKPFHKGRKHFQRKRKGKKSWEE